MRVEADKFDPYVRMMRTKRSSMMSGKWRDIDYVFTYVASGSAEFIVEGVKYQLSAGDAIIIPPYRTHIIISQGKEPLVQYIMHFDFFEEEERIMLQHKDVLEDEEYQPMVSDRERNICQEVLVAELPDAERNDIVRRYLNLIREFKENRPGRGMMLKADSMALLITIFRNSKKMDEGEVDRRAAKNRAWVHIEKAVEYINRTGVKDEPDNEKVAKAIGVTPNYLIRVFKECLGISLHKYVMNLKVEKAQQILLTSQVNVTEAARLAGFSSIHVFSKTFKSYMGISPSEFMEQNVNRENIEERNEENVV